MVTRGSSEWREDSETNNVVQFGYDGTDQKAGSRTGSGRVKDVELLFGSDCDGQDQERALQRDSTGQTF